MGQNLKVGLTGGVGMKIGDLRSQKLEFLDMVLGKIESNDPALTKLIIHPFSEGYRLLTDNEWERLGEAIGTSTHLQDVFINDFRGPYRNRFLHILPGFARNRSIQ